MKMRHHFIRFGKWVVIGSGLIGGATIAANCSAATWSPTSPPPTPKWDYNWDKREPYSLIKPSKKRSASAPPSGKDQEDYSNQLEKKKSKAIRHIFLIRHGQYNLNGKDDCERTLTKLGERQAEETGKRLKSLGLDFDCLITSTMTRAIQTAEIIQKVIGKPEISNKDPMLREGAPTQAEPPVSSWHPELHQYYQDGARIEAAFRKYFHRAEPDQTEDSYEIIVCHANVIRYFFCRALQFPGEAWLRISLNHASITCLSITPSGRVILRALGDSGHLEPEMLTTS